MMSLLNNDAATPHLTPMVGRDDLWPAPVTARYAAMTAHDARQLPNAIGCTLQAIGENLED